MIDILWDLFEIAATCFETWVILTFAKKFLGQKSSGKKAIIEFWVSWLAFSAIVICVNSITAFESFAALLFSVVVFIYCLLYLKGNVYVKIIVSIIPIASIILVNSLVATIISTIFGEGFDDLITKQTIYRCLTVIITKLFLYYVLLIIQKIFEKEKKYSFGVKEWIPIISTFLISAAIFTSVDLINIHNELDEKGKILVLFAILCLVILNIVSFYMVVKISRTSYIETENKLLKMQNEYQSNYVANVKNQEKELKTIRHDLKHNLFVIEAQLKCEKYDEAKNYVSQLLNQEVLVGGTVLTDNATVNAIINSKIIYAKSLGVKIVVQSCKQIIAIPDIDLCNLLGNLIDNAIEACEQCNFTEKLIEIQISSNEDIMTFSIRNTVEKSVLENNPKLVTSKKKYREHGLGLASVNQIVNKYNGKLDIYEKNGMFCVTAILRTEE